MRLKDVTALRRILEEAAPDGPAALAQLLEELREGLLCAFPGDAEHDHEACRDVTTDDRWPEPVAQLLEHAAGWLREAARTEGQPVEPVGLTGWNSGPMLAPPVVVAQVPYSGVHVTFTGDEVHVVTTRSPRTQAIRLSRWDWDQLIRWGGALRSMGLRIPRP